MLVAAASMALLSPVSGSALHSATYQPASAVRAATPTAVPTDVSTVGSTDGIMWMGIVIAAIVIVPLLIRRSTWRRS
jgi:hypothetical protein